MGRIKETDLLQTFYRLMINQEGEKKPVNYTVFFMYTTFSYLNLSVEKTINQEPENNVHIQQETTVANHS